jgi:hypothetical protein
VADDNYAWEVWEAAGRYPPQNAASDLVTVRVSGAVVAIFDEDRDNRYPYMTTWLEENQNESDMALSP